jgi:hypothetical protein
VSNVTVIPVIPKLFKSILRNYERLFGRWVLAVWSTRPLTPRATKSANTRTGVRECKECEGTDQSNFYQIQIHFSELNITSWVGFRKETQYLNITCRTTHKNRGYAYKNDATTSESSLGPRGGKTRFFHNAKTNKDKFVNPGQGEGFKCALLYYSPDEMKIIHDVCCCALTHIKRPVSIFQMRKEK